MILRNVEDVKHWLEGWRPVPQVKPVALPPLQRRPKSRKSKRGK